MFGRRLDVVVAKEAWPEELSDPATSEVGNKTTRVSDREW